MFKLDFLARFKSFLGLSEIHPRKKQLLDFSWDIEIFNDSSEFSQGELFLPLPLNLPSQKIIQEPVFTPAADKTAVEKMYGNHYISWKVSLKPGEKKSFLCQFQAEISPVQFLPRHKFFLSDYAPVKFKNAIWLSANCFLQPENPEIQKIAREIAGIEKDVLSIIKKLNAYVANHLKYGQSILGLYSAMDFLKKETVDCGGFASFLASLCISLGIPARIVSGFWAGYDNNAMHVWAEIQLPDGSWIPADPTVESLRDWGRTRKTGALGFIGSDRIIFSYGCDLEIETPSRKIKIDILQNPFYKGTREDKIKIEHKLKTERLNKNG
jgi:hypothetical protein